jgi:uncharacterized protein (DUF362 family)
MRFFGGKISRRAFVDRSARSLAVLVPALRSLRPANAAGTPARPLGPSRVVTVRDDNALVSGTRMNEAVVRTMLDTGIRALTGIPDTGEAWKSLFPGITASSVIGIKLNCLFRSMSTHPPVTDAVVRGLKLMVVDGNPFPENNIVIWDREDGHLRAAGYTINRAATGVQCYGTGGSYGSRSYSVAGGGNQYLSRILLDKLTYFVNLSVLKNHSISGVSLSLKNHLGTCNDPGGLHGSGCDPSLAALNAIPAIRDKQAVCICDAILGTISGGPDNSPQVTPKAILLSRDTVALDTVGAELLAQHGCRTASLSGAARHIATAARSPYSLGTRDAASMEKISIENPSSPTFVEEETLRPPDGGYALHPNHPNPFNGRTELAFTLPSPGRARIAVFNASGRRVRVLADGFRDAGTHRVQWDGTDAGGRALPSGLYLAVLEVGPVRRTVKMQIVQ